MDRPTSHDVAQAINTLEAAGYTWKHGDDELREHLARHAPDSLTVGSKFSPAAWARLEDIHQQASDMAVVALAKALNTGQPLLVEITIPDPEAGTEGVAGSATCAGLSTLTRTQVLRDPGTVYEQLVNVVVLATGQEFPRARQFLAPAGVLWDSKQMGLYTLFPGSASRPFPRAEQARTAPEVHQANVAFWAEHAFLATPEQALHALRESVGAMQTTSKSIIHAQQEELARVSALVDGAGAARVRRGPG